MWKTYQNVDIILQLYFVLFWAKNCLVLIFGVLDGYLYV